MYICKYIHAFTHVYVYLPSWIWRVNSNKESHGHVHIDPGFLSFYFKWIVESSRLKPLRRWPAPLLFSFLLGRNSVHDVKTYGPGNRITSVLSIWSVLSSISSLYRWRSSLGLLCHVPLKRDQWGEDWKLRLYDTPNAIGYTFQYTW